MTLIIASLRRHDLILTADGRSTTRTNGKVTGVKDSTQKLFPVPEHPVVIAHLGVNNMHDGGPINRLIANFVAQLNTGNFTILQIGEELRHFAQLTVRARLDELQKNGQGCAFWVGGFGFHEDEPSVIEIFWSFKEGAFVTVEQRFKPISVVFGGDGKKLVNGADWHEVDGKSPDQVHDYHMSLMNQALTADVEDNPVGGHVHELVIDHAEWRWTHSPARPTSAPATTQ